MLASKSRAATSGGRSCFDGLVDDGRVDRLAIAGGPVGADVEERGRGWKGCSFARCSSEGWKRSGGRGGEANAAQPQKVTTGGIKWSHGAGHATRADVPIGNLPIGKHAGQVRSQYKYSCRLDTNLLGKSIRNVWFCTSSHANCDRMAQGSRMQERTRFSSSWTLPDVVQRWSQEQTWKVDSRSSTQLPGGS